MKPFPPAFSEVQNKQTNTKQAVLVLAGRDGRHLPGRRDQGGLGDLPRWNRLDRRVNVAALQRPRSPGPITCSPKHDHVDGGDGGDGGGVPEAFILGHEHGAVKIDATVPGDLEPTTAEPSTQPSWPGARTKQTTNPGAIEKLPVSLAPIRLQRHFRIPGRMYAHGKEPRPSPQSPT